MPLSSTGPCHVVVDWCGPLPLVSSWAGEPFHCPVLALYVSLLGTPPAVTLLCSIGRKCGAPALYESLLSVHTLQVTLVGSNGREYLFLAKPKDDLRKDVRIMEVAGVLNRLFAKEPASRRRNLYLRRCCMVWFEGNNSQCTQTL